MIRFYAPDIVNTGILPESDSAHAIRVLRMREGDRLMAVDGRGNVMLCRIVEPHPKHTAVEIIETVSEALSWQQQITLAVAPTKHLDRMEWLVEKLTEVGVNRIIPILCDRSERKEIKTGRLEKIAVSAMKQSLKATLPVISSMTRFADILSLQPDTSMYMGYCDDSIERTDFAAAYRPRRSSLIIIGPEGDFSPAEVSLALSAGVVPVTFGDNRLRTETAALYGVSACHILDAATPTSNQLTQSI